MSKVDKIEYSPVAGFMLIEEVDSSNFGGSNVKIYGEEDRPQFAKVLKVGSPSVSEYTGKETKSPCKPGDYIVHSSVGWEHVKLGNTEYKVLPFSKVLLIKK